MIIAFLHFNLGEQCMLSEQIEFLFRKLYVSETNKFSLLRKGTHGFYNVKIMVSENIRCLLRKLIQTEIIYCSYKNEKEFK
jgi:hypothetical protein